MADHACQWPSLHPRPLEDGPSQLRPADLLGQDEQAQSLEVARSMAECLSLVSVTAASPATFGVTAPGQRPLDVAGVHAVAEALLHRRGELGRGAFAVLGDHDTAAFPVNAVRRWWQVMGAERYPKARR